MATAAVRSTAITALRHYDRAAIVALFEPFERLNESDERWQCLVDLVKNGETSDAFHHLEQWSRSLATNNEASRPESIADTLQRATKIKDYTNTYFERTKVACRSTTLNDKMTHLEQQYLLVVYGYTLALRLLNVHEADPAADKLRSILLSNRAQAHLLFRKPLVAFQDGVMAISYNSKYVKAYHRALMGLLDLTADDFSASSCTMALELHNLGLARADGASSLEEFVNLRLECLPPFKALRAEHHLRLTPIEVSLNPRHAAYVLNNTSSEDLAVSSHSSPVLQKLGVPLCLRRLSTTEADVDNNILATYLMIDPITFFAPPQWQRNVGPVLLYRSDGVDLSAAQVFLLWDYLSQLLSLDEPPTPNRKHFIDFQFSYCSMREQQLQASSEEDKRSSDRENPTVLPPTQQEREEWGNADC